MRRPGRTRVVGAGIPELRSPTPDTTLCNRAVGRIARTTSARSGRALDPGRSWLEELSRELRPAHISHLANHRTLDARFSSTTDQPLIAGYGTVTATMESSDIGRFDLARARYDCDGSVHVISRPVWALVRGRRGSRSTVRRCVKLSFRATATLRAFPSSQWMSNVVKPWSAAAVHSARTARVMIPSFARSLLIQ